MYCPRVMPCSNRSLVITPGTLSRESRGTPPMKITRVQTLVLNLPMVIEGATPMLGGRPRTSSDMLLVRIDTDGGVTGWGGAGRGGAVRPPRLPGHALRRRQAARPQVRRPRPEPDRGDQRRDAAPPAR